ncbi:hypothetical protein FRC04_004987 [Tulasnella sp. 424]|nr:hypothetical protein FRC04_004987 [Tulasnella sp. 424]
MNVPRSEPKLETIPEPPNKFGDDGGHFYRYYDALADELDEDMVKSLKAQLDGILIFAGLFAGVNSAFLALTLPAMSADPADDTNSLLLQLVTGGNNTIRSAEDLPSATFAPSPGIFPVNVLFSLSLTLAIISAFLAVLGQQWLVYYRKRSGGGAEYQRWEQLRRYLGAKRWRLEAILDDFLPGLLQLALIIFCIGFVAYLRTLSKTMCYVIMGPMTTAGAVLLVMGIVGAWDRIAARRLANNGKRFLTNFPQKIAQCSPIFLPSRKEAWGTVVHIAKGVWDGVARIVNRALDRSGENIAQLEAIAAKRVLCTSEDFNALIYTAVNLHRMTSKESIQCFLCDETVYERLMELWDGGRHSSGSPKVLAGAFSRAFLQLIFIGESAELLVEPRYRQQYSEAFSPSGQHPISLDLLKQNVNIIDECIFMGVELLGTHWNDSIWLLYYCQILRVTLDEKDWGSGLFETRLNHIIANHSIPGDFKPHVICVVAWGVQMLNMGIVTPMKTLTRRVSDQKRGLEWVQVRAEWVQVRAKRVQVQAEQVQVRAERVRQRAWRAAALRQRAWRAVTLGQRAMSQRDPAGPTTGAALAAARRAAALAERAAALAGRAAALAGRAAAREQEAQEQEAQELEELELEAQELEVQALEAEEVEEQTQEEHAQQRVKVVKELVGLVGLEKPLVPKGGLEQ